MCCRTFVFYNTKTDSYVYPNAPDHADKDKLFWLYIHSLIFEMIREACNEKSL